MSDDDIPPPRFSGRTYSRSRHNAASRAFDEAIDKATMSISKCGNANYVPVHGGSDGASEPKKVKMESKGDDPFSFDTEDKRKLTPAKKQETTAHEPEFHKSTKLPASRIFVNDDYERYSKVQNEEDTESPVFPSYSNTSSKTPVIMDHFVGVKRKTTSGHSMYFSGARLTTSEKQDEKEDDICSIHFERDPLKTYPREAITPFDKPDSPSQRKFGYNNRGGLRGRMPLTVADPALIEENKGNYEAFQMKGKSDTAVKESNNCTVVSKQKLANEGYGAPVVCKPKSQLDKGELQTKQSVRSSKLKGNLVTVTSGMSASQEEHVNIDSSTSISTSTETVPSRASAKLQIVSLGIANSLERSSSANGGSRSQPSSASTKHVTKQSIAHNAELIFSNQSLVMSDNSQSDGSVGHSAKRYRIFKSRAPQVEEELKPPVFKRKTVEDSYQSSSKQDVNPSSHSDISTIKDRGAVFLQADLTSRQQTQSPLRSLDSSQTSYSAEPANGTELEFEPLNIKPTEPSAARELLAARLRNIDKNVDSDSTSDLDNASECSESLPSQETPSNIKNVLEGGNQNEISVVAPRRFFKSKKSLSGTSDLQKRIFGSSPLKTQAKATYNARSWQSVHEADINHEEKAKKILKKENDDVILIKNPEKGPKLKREVHWPERKYDEAYTSLKVSKTHKELYTVVLNVKQTHEVQELGETQDFMDEVDYLLDSLQNTNTTAIRCLSCLKLASKCISPAFRMHMRAHGTVSKIFSLLCDACSDPCLALSASSMMFMLSRDRLNMDLDHDSLNLMLKLNEVDAGDSAALDVFILRDLEKTKQKVKELLAQLQQETHAREIDLGFVSTGNLALESLLSLTSRRAGEWFKEELRSVGGLDHIVDSVKFCERSLPDDLSQDIQKALPVLRKLDRCLRVLENISYMNSDNQNYLILYKNAVLLQACTRTLHLCQLCMPTYKLLENLDEKKALKDSPGYTILTCILDVLRVLLNITHENQLGNLDVADETCLMETIVRCLTMTLWCIPGEQRFDLAVLCLGLLINLVEHRETNRKIMMNMQTQVKYAERSHPKTMSAIRAVVELFVQKEQAAREMEEDAEAAGDTCSTQSPNKSGEWKETDTSIQWITNNLKKAKEEQEKQKAASSSMEGEAMDDSEGNQSILEDEEETFTKALHKAGKHMENSIVASYAGLLLGSTVTGNKGYASDVKKLIPNEDFGPMIKLLKKFLNFMSLTTAFGNTDVNGITKVIEVLESA